MRRPVPAYVMPEAKPIAELNMTPLIDVLLVLIVMFILLVPAITHEVAIELPQGPPAVSAPPVAHRLVMARDGGLMLDGVGVSDAGLAERLAMLVRADATATLTVNFAPLARYERADQVLAVVKRAGVTRLGFEGLGAADYSAS